MAPRARSQAAVQLSQDMFGRHNDDNAGVPKGCFSRLLDLFKSSKKSVSFERMGAEVPGAPKLSDEEARIEEAQKEATKTIERLERTRDECAQRARASKETAKRHLASGQKTAAANALRSSKSDTERAAAYENQISDVYKTIRNMQDHAANREFVTQKAKLNSLVKAAIGTPKEQGEFVKKPREAFEDAAEANDYFEEVQDVLSQELVAANGNFENDDAELLAELQTEMDEATDDDIVVSTTPSTSPLRDGGGSFVPPTASFSMPPQPVPKRFIPPPPLDAPPPRVASRVALQAF